MATFSLVEEFLDQVVEWLLFAFVDEVELRDEGHEVFKTRVEVRFSADAHDFVKVRVVHVCVDSEETTEDVFHHGLEATTVGNSFTGWEERLVTQQFFHPRHEHVDVLGCREFGGGFVLLVILPQILKFGASTHLGARLTRAKLEDCAVHNADLVEEVHRWSKIQYYW